VNYNNITKIVKIAGKGFVMANIVADSANIEVPAVDAKHVGKENLGIAIRAISDNGVGIYGKGGKNSGVFDGDVQINSKLSVGGVEIDGIAGRLGLGGKNPALWAGGNVGMEGNKILGMDSSRNYSIEIDPLDSTLRVGGVEIDGIAGRLGLGGKNPALWAGGNVGMEGNKILGIDSSRNYSIEIDPLDSTLRVGSVQIDGIAGDVILQNADCAEDFEVSAAEPVEPGTVMALNDEGQLEQGKQPYDKRVAGVISGAGDLKPGLVLGRQPGHSDRVPLALMGRVHCKVDADYGSIEVGDLLTTSQTPGYAMKASDPARSFGAVIGKALRPLKNGRDLIPILVALQ
jgi:hypothetical protein